MRQKRSASPSLTIASLAGTPLAEMPGGREFAARYEARFKTPVEIYAPYAYDAAQVLVAAMKRANSVDPAKYLAELAATQMRGVTSMNIAYDEKGDLKDGAITLYRVADGEWKTLEIVARR